jgi:hypothetical protein
MFCWTLITNPDASQKIFKILFISNHSDKEAFVIIRISSTKRRWRTLINLETFIPVILPLAWLSFNARLSPSIMRMKSKGDKGHPCHSPLPLLKKSIGSPLIKIAYVAELTHPMIHLIVGSPKPHCKSTSEGNPS